jgi:hypothetical protein
MLKEFVSQVVFNKATGIENVDSAQDSGDSGSYGKSNDPNRMVFNASEVHPVLHALNGEPDAPWNLKREVVGKDEEDPSDNEMQGVALEI